MTDLSPCFRWGGLSPWSESIISSCGRGAPAPQLTELQLPPPPPAPLSPPAGLSLPPDGASLEWTVRLLLSADLQRRHPAPLEPPELPRPGPGPAAFLVSEPGGGGGGAEARGEGALPRDTGDGWVPGSTAVLNYLVNERVFERVYRNQAGRFCVREAVKRQLEPLLTPSDRIVEVRRELSTWWRDAGRVRRVTRLAHCDAPAVALYEFYPDDGQTRPADGPGSRAGEPRQQGTGGEQGDGPPVEDALLCPLSSVAGGLGDCGGSTSRQIPAGGLSDTDLIRLLLDPTTLGSALDRPPELKEPNTAYLIDNAANRERRRRGAACRYEDGPERWEGGEQRAGRISTYLLDGSGARHVSFANGRYMRPVRRGPRRVLEPLEPPATGEETVVLLRAVLAPQVAGSLRRRISWVESCDPAPARLPAVALYEYMQDETHRPVESVQVQTVNVRVKRAGDPGSGSGSESEAESGSDGEVKRTEGQNGFSVKVAKVKRQRRDSDS